MWCKPRLTTVSTLLLAVFSALILLSSTSQAAITVTGNTNPIYNSNDPWTVIGDLIIAETADANMIIAGGSSVTNTSGYICYNFPTTITGLVTVTDPNSVWTNTANLYVGYKGTGLLTISNQAQVTDANHGFIGWSLGSYGTVNISDPNTAWRTTQNLHIGYSGTGTLNISNDANVYSYNGYIGYNHNSNGTVTIAGPNSLWQNTGALDVGYHGDANMIISDGATVKSYRYTIAYYDDSNGTVTITGPNSLWHNNFATYIGRGGNGKLTVSNKAVVHNGTNYIAYHTGSKGTLIVTDPNTVFENSVKLYVGFNGDANMVISNGAKVTDPCAIAALDVNSFARVTVTGQNSTWRNATVLAIGYKGDGVMTIADKGQVLSEYGFTSIDSNSFTTVTITDPNSIWYNSNSIYIGGDETTTGGKTNMRVINGGTLSAQNYITVWKTSSIGGDGTLKATRTTIHGTIRPGNEAIGTLHIDGSLSIDPCSVFEVKLDNSGNNDKIAVTGNATINGGTVKPISTETITQTREYTILTANSVSGKFDTLDTALLDVNVPLPDVSLGYDPNAVKLMIRPTPFGDPRIIKNINHQALGNALEQIRTAGGNQITTLLQQMTSLSDVSIAYNQLAAQSRPGITPVTAVGTSKFIATVNDRFQLPRIRRATAGFRKNSMLAMTKPISPFTNQITDQFMNPYSNSFSPQPQMRSNAYNFAFGNGAKYYPDKKWGVWGKGYGMLGRRTIRDNIPGYKYTGYGASLGFDYKTKWNWLLGVTAGYSGCNMDYHTISDNTDLSGIHIGFYGSRDMDIWYVDSVLTYSMLSYDTTRYVSIPVPAPGTSLNETLKGSFSGSALSAYVETGLNWNADPGYLIQTLVGAQASYTNIEGYTETGGQAALTFDSQSYVSYKSTLGLKVVEELMKQHPYDSFILEIRALWFHEFGDTQSKVNAFFNTNPTAGFTISDMALNRDTAVVGAGLDTKIGSTTRVFINYDLAINSDITVHILSASLEHRW